MKITCLECGTSGNLNEKLIPDEGRTVKCRKCKHTFFITKPSPSFQGSETTEAISPLPEVSNLSPPVNIEPVNPKTARMAAILGVLIGGCLLLFIIAGLLGFLDNTTTTSSPSRKDKRFTEAKAEMEKEAVEFYKKNGYLVEAKVTADNYWDHVDILLQIEYVATISNGSKREDFDFVNLLYKSKLSMTALNLGIRDNDKLFVTIEATYPNGQKKSF